LLPLQTQPSDFQHLAGQVAEHPGDRTADLGRLQAVRQPGPVVVALVVDEDLGLVLEAAERGAVDDPVPVAKAAHNELFEPADLKDEGDSRWRGRTFLLKRALDPRTGLGADSLITVDDTGNRSEFLLPGEACGPSGRFGRPHYRIIENGETGIDLRFVDGGCHAVQIHLTTGAWRRLDHSNELAECDDTGNIPAMHLNTALRGYSREVQAARVEAGADASAAYALIIDPDGSTHVETRNVEGEPVRADVPRFPLTTPLRRIDVSLVGAAGKKSPSTLPPPPGPDLKTLNPL